MTRLIRAIYWPGVAYWVALCATGAAGLAAVAACVFFALMGLAGA